MSGQKKMGGRDRMLAALSLERVDRPPVWFMRQAGRHLPGYRRLRAAHSFLEICSNEALNAEVSTEPWRRYGVDGAIVFNDILSPLIDMGMELEFAPGPRFTKLIATPDDVARLKQPRFGRETAVYRCIGALKQQVANQAAVLGFVGAPMTVAAFTINGSGPQKRGALAEIMSAEPEVFEAMQEALLPVLAEYAALQVDAGADVIQIFESLADELSPEMYARVGLPRLLALIDSVRRACPTTPIITFGRGLAPHLGAIAASPTTAISLDPTVDLRAVRRQLRELGCGKGVQGNLPPEVLLQEPLVAGGAAAAMLENWREIVPRPEDAEMLGPTGWVFNLGHGVPADADPASVEAVVEVLRAFGFGPHDGAGCSDPGRVPAMFKAGPPGGARAEATR